MRMIRAAVLAILLGVSGSAALAQDAQRIAMERQITTLLHSRTFWSFPPDRPQGPPDMDIVFGDAPIGEGWLAVELTARFEGCHLVTEVFRRVNSDPVRIETRTDLALLHTGRDAVSNELERKPPLFGPYELTPTNTVKVRFWPWVSERLMETRLRSGPIRDRAQELFPDDLPARFAWIDEQQAAVLLDKTYLTAGAQTWISSDGTHTDASNSDFVRFSLAPESAGTFVAALSDYAATYCPPRTQPPATGRQGGA